MRGCYSRGDARSIVRGPRSGQPVVIPGGHRASDRRGAWNWFVGRHSTLSQPTSQPAHQGGEKWQRGVGLVVLSMGGERPDTRNPTSKLMLTILAGVATREREIMLERQREGIAKAKADGKYKGRPASIDAAQIRRLTATMGPAAIAKQLGIARSTVYRLLGQAA
jgi:Resolvase, N terminal domain/IclR helix-turn-helix domain